MLTPLRELAMSTRFDFLELPFTTADRASFDSGMKGYFDDPREVRVDADGNFEGSNAKAALAGWLLGKATGDGVAPQGAAVMTKTSENAVRAMVEAGIADESQAARAYKLAFGIRGMLLERERFEQAAVSAGIAPSELVRWPDGLYQFDATRHAFCAWQLSRAHPEGDGREVWLRAEPDRGVLRQLAHDAEEAKRIYTALFQALDCPV